jgi:hypothetical protein
MPEYGTIDDLINNETETEEIEHEDKLYEITYKKKLSNEELWRLVDDNGDLSNGDIQLSGFIPGYLDTIITDASIDRVKTAVKKGDPEFAIKLLQITGNPLKELEKLDNIESEGNLSKQ